MFVYLSIYLSIFFWEEKYIININKRLIFMFNVHEYFIYMHGVNNGIKAAAL